MLEEDFGLSIATGTLDTAQLRGVRRQGPPRRRRISGCERGTTHEQLRAQCPNRQSKKRPHVPQGPHRQPRRNRRRITRTLREMGIRVGRRLQRGRPRRAARAHGRRGATPSAARPRAESYLRIDRIIDAAQRAGADAIHPGYGFLSENAELRRGVRSGRASSSSARRASRDARDGQQAGGARADGRAPACPIVPGGAGELARRGARHRERARLPGDAQGRGRRRRQGDAPGRTRGRPGRRLGERAQRCRAQAFGDDTVYLEKAIVRPRHVEIQVLGDRHGNVVHLFERDCSIQRRHQKVVEETPCPVATPELIARMGEVAVAGREAVGYDSAGTFEFLLAERRQLLLPRDEHAPAGRAPRHRVDHRGRSRTRDGSHRRRRAARLLRRANVVRRGASIECRVYAEDPAPGLLAEPGHHHVAHGASRALACATTARPTPAPRSRATTIRSSRSSACGARTAPPRSRACSARSASIGSPASAPTSASTDGCSRTPSSRRATTTPVSSPSTRRTLLGDAVTAERDTLAAALAVAAATRTARTETQSQPGANADPSPWAAVAPSSSAKGLAAFVVCVGRRCGVGRSVARRGIARGASLAGASLAAARSQERRPWRREPPRRQVPGTTSGTWLRSMRSRARQRRWLLPPRARHRTLRA